MTKEEYISGSQHKYEWSDKPHLVSLEIDCLVGLTVESALINLDHDIVLLKTDVVDLWLTWVGDCCAKCFIQHINGTESLLGATITNAFNSKWVKLKDKDYDVIESMGTKITTNKGYFDIETRLEHNSYYSGEIHINAIAPMDQYRDEMAIDMSEFIHVKDF